MSGLSDHWPQLEQSTQVVNSFGTKSPPQSPLNRSARSSYESAAGSIRSISSSSTAALSTGSPLFAQHDSAPHSSPFGSLGTVRKQTPTVKKSFELEPYLMLGVSQNASEDEIIKAYRRLALLNHPRRHGIGIGGENKQLQMDIRIWKFIALAACFETLAFPQYRHQYDAAMDAFIEDRRRKEMNRNRRKRGFKKAKGIWENVKRGLDIVDSEDPPNGRSRESTEARDEFSQSRNDLNGEKIECIMQTRTDYVSLMQNNSPLSEEEKESRFSSDYDYDSPNSEEENEEVRQETDMLFGGPLAPLYKARNHEPFTDADTLFEREFGSQIFRCCIDEEETSDDDGDLPEDETVEGLRSRSTGYEELSISANFNKSSKRGRMGYSKNDMVYPTLPDLSLDVLKQAGVAFAQEPTNAKIDNTNLDATSTSILEETSYDEIIRTETKTRIVGSTRLIRTERTKTNVKSGEKVTSIQVCREELAPEEIDNLREANCRPLQNGRSQSGIVCCLENDISDNSRGELTHSSSWKEVYPTKNAVNSSFQREGLQSRFHEIFHSHEAREDKNSSQKPFCCGVFSL